MNRYRKKHCIIKAAAMHGANGTDTSLNLRFFIDRIIPKIDDNKKVRKKNISISLIESIITENPSSSTSPIPIISLFTKRTASNNAVIITAAIKAAKSGEKITAYIKARFIIPAQAANGTSFVRISDIAAAARNAEANNLCITCAFDGINKIKSVYGSNNANIDIIRITTVLSAIFSIFFTI